QLRRQRQMCIRDSYMNEHIEVVVTSALQTAAGRMIFAKPAHSSRNIKDDSPEKKLDYTNEKAAK
ncbi:hypothetical protein KQJ29_21695, partial [Enterococcus sp. S181_ASV_20]|nr:hypothetical protein [Enterococcus sp. S181_ASV_20]